jgi:alpha-glucoside transport system substrate-binding protein
MDGAGSGFLTPHSGVNSDTYFGEVHDPADERHPAGCHDLPLRRVGPDAGCEIGAGTFWTGMVDFTTGEDAAAVASGIQARWDQLN